MRHLSILLILVCILFICTSCVIDIPFPHTSSTQRNNNKGHTSAAPAWGVQSKETGCQANGPLQDAQCTPGDIFQNASKNDICTPGYARSLRNVSQSSKNLVYKEYGITSRVAGQYEVDHLVSLQLGGTNDISNLWPEAGTPRPGYREKNQVENLLHDMVCAGKISLRDAQNRIATNWLQFYKDVSPNESTSD